MPPEREERAVLPTPRFRFFGLLNDGFSDRLTQE